MSAKRDAILNAALRLIAAHARDHTSMEMIAREAKTGMGTIYNYFPAKEVLINELYREVSGRLLRVTTQGLTADAPLHEQFSTITRNRFRFALEQPEAAQFIEQYGYSPVLSAETQAAAWEVWQLPACILETGRQRGMLKDLPTPVLIALASAPIFSLVKQHTQGHIRLDDALIEAAITACWDSIRR